MFPVCQAPLEEPSGDLLGCEVKDGIRFSTPSPDYVPRPLYFFLISRP